MHADDVEEGLAIDVPAGAGSTRHHVRAEIGFGKALFRGLGGRRQRLAELGNSRGLEIGLAAHDCGDAGGVVAAGVGVVGQTACHQQCAEVGVSQAQRTIVVGIPADHFRGISGVVDQDFLRGDDHVHGMTVGFDVESAVGSELQQIQAREIAG